MLKYFLIYYLFGLGLTAFCVKNMTDAAWSRVFDTKLVIVIAITLYPIVWPYYAWLNYKEKRDARLRGRR